MRPLRLALPFLDSNLLRKSLLRFSGEVYALRKGSFLLDLLLSLLATPLAAITLWLRSGKEMKAFDRVDLLLHCGDAAYYETFLKKTAESLGGMTIKKAGTGEKMDCPPMSNRFLLRETLRVGLGMILLIPYLACLSLVFRRNFLWAFSKTAVIYCRGSCYFRKYPSRIFLTYADNMCSPPLYGAFKNAGGTAFCAIQNGIRFADEGIEYSYFDHLFCIGPSSLETYQKKGGTIRQFTSIGSLVLANNLHLLKENPTTLFDVMFVDQGYPVRRSNFWGSNGAKEDVWTFLEFVKRFSLERPDLRLVYQMRCYKGYGERQEARLREWFAGIPLLLREGCTPMQSYNTILESRLAVTMCSTLGLAAPLLDKPVLFFNFSGKEIYNVIAGPCQICGRDYHTFKREIESLLQEHIIKPINYENYISRNTFGASAMIAKAIRREIKGTE